jgi:hypothetical protein
MHVPCQAVVGFFLLAHRFRNGIDAAPIGLTSPGAHGIGCKEIKDAEQEHARRAQGPGQRAAEES